MSAKKTVIGHKYEDTNYKFNVETDYMNERIYLESPTDDDDTDIECMESFANTILRAIKDFRKKVK